MCLAGASGAGADLLAALPHPDLRVRYVWVPVLPGDGVDAAERAATRFADPRAAHYWDGDRRLALALARRLGMSARESIGAGDGPGLAWDVYLAYGRGEAERGRPGFWRHQLGVTHAPRLDAEVFTERVEALLRA